MGPTHPLMIGEADPHRMAPWFPPLCELSAGAGAGARAAGNRLSALFPMV